MLARFGARDFSGARFLRHRHRVHAQEGRGFFEDECLHGKLGKYSVAAPCRERCGSWLILVRFDMRSKIPAIASDARKSDKVRGNNLNVLFVIEKSSLEILIP